MLEIEKYTKVKMPAFKIARWFAYATGFLSEIYYKIIKQKPLFTSYAVYTLGTNCNFSNEKAKKELGYTIRPIDETIRDTIDWFREMGKIK
ncbi:nAD-dependent epimerase/dehydratase [Clostridium sp. CAG:273]|nr:nAD-dependent epimerase/dehydratase [Clostridium sp. CAG:273]